MFPFKEASSQTSGPLDLFRVSCFGGEREPFGINCPKIAVEDFIGKLIAPKVEWILNTSVNVCPQSDSCF